MATLAGMVAGATPDGAAETFTSNLKFTVFTSRSVFRFDFNIFNPGLQADNGLLSVEAVPQAMHGIQFTNDVFMSRLKR